MTKLKNKRYIALIDMKKSNTNDLLSVAIPDFPNCVTVGRDFDDAVRMAHEIDRITKNRSAFLSMAAEKMLNDEFK